MIVFRQLVVMSQPQPYGSSRIESKKMIATVHITGRSTTPSPRKYTRLWKREFCILTTDKERCRSKVALLRRIEAPHIALKTAG